MLASVMCDAVAAKGCAYAQATVSSPRVIVSTATQTSVPVAHASVLAIPGQSSGSVQTDAVTDSQDGVIRRVVEQQAILEEELRQTDEDARSKIAELRDRMSHANRDKASMAHMVEALTAALDRAKVDLATKESDERDLKGLVKDMAGKLSICDEKIRQHSQVEHRLSAELHERAREAADARAHAAALERCATQAQEDLIEYKARVASLQL